MVTEPFLSFSYECPQCGKAVGAGCSVFSVDTLDCSCVCGYSLLKAELYDGVLTVKYPCSVCGIFHEADIIFSELIRLRFIALLCPRSQTECCTVAFSDIGEYAITAEEIMSYLSELVSVHAEKLLEEAIALFIEKAKNKCIGCACGSASFTLSTHENKVVLCCENCGAIREFQVSDRADISIIKNIEEIIL